jgi:hypothetical protein
VAHRSLKARENSSARPPVQAQHQAELPGRVVGQSLGTLDSHQGHQAEGQQHRRQAVVPVLQAAVHLLSHFDEPLPEQRGQRHQHARLGHRLCRLELRRCLYEQAGRRQSALLLPLCRHTAATRCILVAAIARRTRGLLGGLFRRGSRDALRPDKPILPDRLADRSLLDSHQLGDLAIRLALVEELLGASQQDALELAGAAGTAPPDHQRFDAALSIPLAIVVHPAAMTVKHLGEFDRRGQTKARLGEYHRCEPQRSFVILLAREDRPGGIEECDASIASRDGEMLADHLGVAG